MFDNGVNKFAQDEMAGSLLAEHCERYGITPERVAENFALYTRIPNLKRFMAHASLFMQAYQLPGDIVELGVYKGVSLMTWAKLLEIYCMGDRQKKVIGFDTFQGSVDMHEKDGAEDAAVEKHAGGYNGGEDALKDAIAMFDADRFIPYKPRIELVKGDITQTVPEYVKAHPGLRISLLHFDCDYYEPTLTGLKELWPLVVPGGVVIFDEYGIQPWEGESRAVDEFFQGRARLIKGCVSGTPGAYVVKGA